HGPLARLRRTVHVRGLALHRHCERLRGPQQRQLVRLRLRPGRRHPVRRGRRRGATPAAVAGAEESPATAAGPERAEDPVAGPERAAVGVIGTGARPRPPWPSRPSHTARSGVTYASTALTRMRLSTETRWCPSST